MEYLHFTFDGISSSKYNLIIQNNGEDLSFPSQPGFDNQLVSPLYQGTNFLAGVNKKERVFNFNCWVDSITRKQLIDMQKWLSVDKTAYLVLDYNPNFKYKVKLSSISDLKHMAINADQTTSNYEFSLGFITVGEFAAISNIAYTSAATGETGPDGFERGFTTVNGGTKDVYFYNFYNLPFYLNFAATAITSLLISKNAVAHYNYGSLPSGNYTVNSKYGFCLNSSNVLAESLSGVTFTNKGPMPIDSDIKVGTGIVTGSTIASLDFTPAANIRYLMIETQAVYTTLTALKTAFGLAEGATVQFKYLYPTKITMPSAGVTYSFNYRDNL